jgi:hypothetical protein
VAERAGNLGPHHEAAVDRRQGHDHRHDGNFARHHERKRIEQELHEHRIHLEELVAKRTAELVRAKDLLEQDIAARKIADEELAQKAKKLALANAELENLSLVDDLTGLYNPKGSLLWRITG